MRVKLTKRQIEVRLEEIAGDMIVAEFSKKYAKFYDLKEEQVLLADKLERRDYLRPPLPRCGECHKPTARYRFVHWETGDTADFIIMCPRCPLPPTRAKGRKLWVEDFLPALD
jgi:hypothetical protein